MMQKIFKKKMSTKNIAGYAQRCDRALPAPLGPAPQQSKVPRPVTGNDVTDRTVKTFVFFLFLYCILFERCKILQKNTTIMIILRKANKNIGKNINGVIW